jgi:excisionase family DNA binding protein
MTRSPDLMTWAEAAIQLGCSVRTVQRLRAAGLIGYTKVGSTVYFSPADVAAYIDSQHVPASAGAQERRKRKAS